MLPNLPSEDEMAIEKKSLSHKKAPVSISDKKKTVVARKVDTSKPAPSKVVAALKFGIY
jgi:hypothetical protein